MTQDSPTAPLQPTPEQMAKAYGRGVGNDTHSSIAEEIADMSFLAGYRSRDSAFAALKADAEAVRELMNVYNLGGWTDAVAPMLRAQKAERECQAKDERIAELMRSLEASDEDCARAEERIAALVAALTVCRDKFMEYERLHAAKGDGGIAKAVANRILAEECNAALSGQPVGTA